MSLAVWLVVAFAVLVVPVPDGWVARLPWLGDISTRIAGLIGLLVVVLAGITFAIIRRDDVRSAIIGSAPELKTSGYQKILGAAVAVLVALIAVFGVLTTVEASIGNTDNQLAAQEEAHLNERFEAAAQMLGDTDSAAVRSAGITALAAIADDWMARAERGQTDEEDARLRRDQCIRTIEAYLKTPPPEDNPHAGQSVAQVETEDGRVVYESGNEIVDASTVRGGVVIHAAAWEQERAVRQTVNKTITDHLSSVDPEEGSTDPSSMARLLDPRTGEDWGDHRFDFSSAYLIDADFTNAVFFPEGVDFSGAQFSGDASFRGAQFSGDASFRGAQFSGGASFWEAQFSGGASFWEAQFSGGASFGGAQFSGDASFGGAQFSGDASFGGAQFSGGASFWEAQFSGGASFWEAQFSGGASFWEAQFSGDASFREAQFSGDASFREAQFSGDAYFREAQFGGGVCYADDGTTTACVTTFADAFFKDATSAESGLRAAASPSDFSGSGMLAAHSTISLGSGDDGSSCSLVNDTDQAVPIPDLPLSCE